MQLETGGFLLLTFAVLYCVNVDAVTPKLWRRVGINFDIGTENLGSRGVDDKLIRQRRKDNQERLIAEAYRWMNNLDKRKAKPEDDDILDELQMEVRTEEQAIDHINEKVERNTVQIHLLQNTICSLLQSICEKNIKPCMPCPWTSTQKPMTEPTKQTITPDMNNKTSTTPFSTPRPSPDPLGSCGKPAAPPNGFVDEKNTTLNTIIKLHCKAGFDLIGSDTVMCTAMWNAIDSEYQYSWAPPMSAICKANGNPSPVAQTTTLATTTSTTTKTFASKNTTKTPAKGKERKRRNVMSIKEMIAMKKRMGGDSFRKFDSLELRGIPPRCILPKRVGVCKAAIPRFFFNSETGDCQPFDYGGCHGNDNNFETKQDCLCQCLSCP